jgi:arylsulfatase A-like enzyme
VKEVKEGRGQVAAALGPDLARTVIVFTSDNGFLHGEHRMSEKVVPYEESIRVPLYLAVPGLAGPVQVNAIALNNDVAPTLAALAGVDLMPADGRSLLDLLDGVPPPDWRRRLLVEHWKSEEGGELDVPDYAAVRTGPDDAYPERLYVEHYENDAVIAIELYDLTEPQGRFQLDSRHAGPARAGELVYLKQRLEALKRCGMADAVSCRQAEE